MCCGVNVYDAKAAQSGTSDSEKADLAKAGARCTAPAFSPLPSPRPIVGVSSRCHVGDHLELHSASRHTALHVCQAEAGWRKHCAIWLLCVLVVTAVAVALASSLAAHFDTSEYTPRGGNGPAVLPEGQLPPGPR